MTSIFWHRRDLRIEDNAGLFKALSKSTSVLPVFIFDTTILDLLPKNDQRVIFIHQEIERLKKEYRNLGSDLRVEYGIPTELIPSIAKETSATAVYTNRDYEPYAKKRDLELFEKLKNSGIAFIGTKTMSSLKKMRCLKMMAVHTPFLRLIHANGKTL